MSDPTPSPVQQAEEISRRLGRLAERLDHLPAPEAAQVLAHVLDADDGVLRALTHLLAAGSVFAKTQAERGALPAEVWLALGRAAHERDDTALDLDPHRQALHNARLPSAATTTKPPAPAPPAARRHR
ncbi:hypothetical protein ACFU99_14010 [Streptomyces sp. NPDC057654]|uniref:hypothetical protein n=1 Tax=Streptomyces sp. NPDC057654 TaxID=3346196 RepID=UPI0036D067A3